MGQTVTTPLSLTLNHWSDVKAQANNLGVVVKKNKWTTLCEAEWVTMEVGWPREGTFNLSLISQVEGKVFAPSPHGHPDQVPYIAMWRLLATEPPPWVRPFLSPPAPRQQQRSPNPRAEEAGAGDRPSAGDRPLPGALPPWRCAATGSGTAGEARFGEGGSGGAASPVDAEPPRPECYSPRHRHRSLSPLLPPPQHHRSLSPLLPPPFTLFSHERIPLRLLSFPQTPIHLLLTS
nr:uncharacterized protein LOC121831503 [Peromyscus maniculatus bairdii]